MGHLNGMYRGSNYIKGISRERNLPVHHVNTKHSSCAMLFSTLSFHWICVLLHGCVTQNHSVKTDIIYLSWQIPNGFLIHITYIYFYILCLILQTFCNRSSSCSPILLLIVLKQTIASIFLIFNLESQSGFSPALKVLILKRILFMPIADWLRHETMFPRKTLSKIYRLEKFHRLMEFLPTYVCRRDAFSQLQPRIIKGNSCVSSNRRL